MSNELSKLTPEEVYGPDMTEMLSEPFPPVFCAICHEQEVQSLGEVCSCCGGGEN